MPGWLNGHWIIQIIIERRRGSTKGERKKTQPRLIPSDLLCASASEFRSNYFPSPSVETRNSFSRKTTRIDNASLDE